MMSRVICTILWNVGALTWASIAVLTAVSPAAWAADSGSVVPADRAFLEALAQKDRAAAGRLLHPDFSWIDSHGRRYTRAEVLEKFPAPANADVEAQERAYGNAAVVRADRGNVHVLRIWVSNAAGWRLMLHQEVAQVEKSEPAGAAGPGECVNPCKTIPYEPQTPSEREAIASWQGVMKAIAENDVDGYAPLIADEFTATDTHRARPYTKADRLAQIQKQKAAGTRSAPPEMVSAQMFDLGETVLMIAREQRKDARSFFNTRMWVKRDGRWQMLFSFNTRVE